MKAAKKIKQSEISMKDFNVRKLLAACFANQLPPKRFAPDPQSFIQLVVDAVIATQSDEFDDHNIYNPSIPHFEDGSDLIEIAKLPGGTLRDSFFVEGVACHKTHSCCDDELKYLENPKVAMFDMKLDPQSRHSDTCQSKDDKIIYDMLDEYVKHGVNIVLSCEAIGDLAKQYFEEKGIACVGLLHRDDRGRVASAVNVFVTTSYTKCLPMDMRIGTCQVYKEEKFGNEVFMIFSKYSTGTIVLRGTDECIKEVMSHIYELIVSLRLVLKDYTVVAVDPVLYREISQFVSAEADCVDKEFRPSIKALAKVFEDISDEVVGIGAPYVLDEKHPLARGEGDIAYEPTSRHIDSIRIATNRASFFVQFPTSDDRERDSNKKVKRAKKKTKPAKKMSRR